jgi:hypothetical protein
METFHRHLPWVNQCHTKTGQGFDHLPELLVAMSMFRVSVLLGDIDMFVEAANNFQWIHESYCHPGGE